ncbi:MAG: hypothetical protein ABI664_15985 [bacterium]
MSIRARSSGALPLETESAIDRKAARAPEVGERMTVYWGVAGARVYQIDECIGCRDDGWLVIANRRRRYIVTRAVDANADSSPWVGWPFM